MNTRCLSAVFALCVPLAAACEPTEKAAPPSAASRPELWRIDVVDDKIHPRSSVEICADEAIRSAFLHPMPEVHHLACSLIGEPTVKGDTYAARCSVGALRFGFAAVVSGDTRRDFTSDIVIRPLQSGDMVFEQVRRYRKVGPCPPDWKVGEQRPLPLPTALNAKP
jgi:hypothetical protein